MKSPFFFAMAVFWLFACATGAEPAAPTHAQKPNIIVFLVDDLGWRDVGYAGSRYYETPNIDRLSTQGMRFNQAYAACAVCSPTRASIMTGKWPARLHITDWIPGEGNKSAGRFTLPDWQKSLPVGEQSLATALKKAGYATAIAGKWHLGNGPSRPEHHGFDTSIGVNQAGQPGSYFFPYGKAGTASHVPLDEDGVGRPDAYLTDRLTVGAQRYIEKHHVDHPEQPFFLYMPHYAVHTPLMAKKALVDKYKAKAPDGGQKNPTYAGMVESMDDGMGGLLATLDKLHLRENTVIVFTGDNGGLSHYPATSNAPLREGKGFAYEGGDRVPLLVVWPGHIPAGQSATPVISTDFYPTLLGLAGVKLDHAVDGVDLAPLWAKEPSETAPIKTRDALFWHYPHYWSGTDVSPYSVVRQGDWKLIHFYETGRWELYNLKDDPSETKDLAKDNPAQVEKLRARLTAWLKETGAQMPVRKP